MAADDNKPNPRVSVVIPSYNTGHLARGAVDSVLAQTMQDFEVVLVDDGSRPEHARLLDEIARHERVRLVRQQNSGPDRARRSGWEAARGEFVSFLDDDDRYETSYLSRCLAWLEANPDYGGVYTRYVTINEQGVRQRVLPARCYSGQIFAREVTKGTVKTSTLMVRRACLLELSNMIENTKASGNYDLILRLCYQNLFGCIDEVLAQVTLRPNSVSKDLARRHQDRTEILENLLRVYPDMDAGARRALYAKIGKYLLKAGRRCARSGRLVEAWGLLWRSLRYRMTPRAFWHYLRTTMLAIR